MHRCCDVGWIDMMDQSGGVLLINGMAENKRQEGVTTAIGGEGGTPVPAGRVAEYFAKLQQQGIRIIRVARARSAGTGICCGTRWKRRGSEGAEDAEENQTAF